MRCREADRRDLLGAQCITIRQQTLDLPLDRRARYRMAGIGGHARRHVSDRLLHGGIAAYRIPFRMRHAGLRFGGSLGLVESRGRSVQANPFDRRLDRVPRQQARCQVRRRRYDVRTSEYGFRAREMRRQIVELFGEFPDRFLLYIHHAAGDRRD